MHDSKWIALVVLVSAGIVAGTLGCGKSNLPDRKPVVSVRGTILFRGQPAAGAVVCLHPLGDSNPRALRSNGLVREDGTFALTTYVTADGTPQGDYVVTVYWADPAKRPHNEDEETDLPPDLLKGRFATREHSLLRAKVGDKPTEFAAVDLGSSEVASSREHHLREK